MNTTFSPEDIAAFEHATWSRCAPGYEAGFAALTRTAVPALLAAASVRSGSHILDIGTGTGVVAAAADRAGAEVIGIDFSEAMITEARRTVPGLEFRAAAADQLPFDDETFDAVVANGVLHHLGDPDKALHEARRVLRPGGRFAATVWADQESLDAFGLFFAAVAAHAGDADLPTAPSSGWPTATLTALLNRAGFSDTSTQAVAATWSMPSIDVLLQAFGTWAQIDAFPAETRTAIETAVRMASSRYQSAEGLTIPNPMVLLTGTRPN